MSVVLAARHIRAAHRFSKDHGDQLTQLIVLTRNTVSSGERQSESYIAKAQTTFDDGLPWGTHTRSFWNTRVPGMPKVTAIQGAHIFCLDAS